MYYSLSKNFFLIFPKSFSIFPSWRESEFAALPSVTTIDVHSTKCEYDEWKISGNLNIELINGGNREKTKNKRRKITKWC